MFRCLPLIVALALTACATTPPAATRSETPAATLALSLPTASPTLTPIVYPSPSPAGTPIAGACTSPASTTSQVLERYFALTTSRDWRMAADCWARPLDSGFTASLERWSNAGPAAAVTIDLLGQANGCDLFSVSANLANGELVAWFGRMSRFFTVGPNAGRPRIFDAGTGLVAPEYMTVFCR